MAQTDRTKPHLIPDGGEKWLLKVDGTELAPVRGFDAVIDKTNEIRDSKAENTLSVGTATFSIIDERGGIIQSLLPNSGNSYPEKTMSAQIVTIKDHIVIDELECPYDTGVDGDSWAIKVGNGWINPIFELTTIEIDGSTYEYVDGRLEEITKEQI